MGVHIFHNHVDAGCVLTVQFQGRTIEFSVRVVSFSMAISQHNHGHPANELSVGNTTALTRNDQVLFKSKGETQPINGFFAILVSQSRHYAYLHVATLVSVNYPWWFATPNLRPSPQIVMAAKKAWGVQIREVLLCYTTPTLLVFSI